MVRDDLNPAPVEFGQNLFAQAAQVLRNEREEPRSYLLQLLDGPHAVGREFGDVLCERLLKARHAYHEELVQVLGEDGEELEAFENRLRRVERLFENAPVELYLAQLAVEEQACAVGARLRRPRARRLARLFV